MALTLFPYQLQAYAAMNCMLDENRRAAVIYPTGTGKSFIAFHLIEEHPTSTFLWLAPSLYIFKTQQDNIRRIAPEIDLDQVQFMTYASLMTYTKDELSHLNYDYLIVDEFHRCGSQAWGEAITALIASHPSAKILGLSATRIRFLDHHRDMADELFDNHVACEMTLGEAIVRGILPAPKYVTTVYQYYDSLSKYQQQISAMRSRPSRERSEKYLNALRRSLEKADGLNQVFTKYLTVPNGRYIVFCASVEHMHEIRSQLGGWLREIDEAPRCYMVHAGAKDANQAYTDFCNDDSEHIKLLLCVNMLNEGVHVDSIAGVILFRPTVSPIIYMQQIGRALTAGTQNEPLILDVVNNVSGLYSCNSLEQEMQEAVDQLRTAGLAELIVHEHFHVLDQENDCRKLFEQLERSLHIGWDEYYRAACKYSKEKGNLQIPQRYVTEDGKCLGQWLVNQRRICNGNISGSLTDEQILLLDQIGIVWENTRSDLLDRYYQCAQEYYAENGNLRVPRQYETEDGCKLGIWIANMRARYKRGMFDRSDRSREMIQKLEAIGMEWRSFDERWEQYFALAKRYALQHGDLLVPAQYRTEDGVALGKWIINQRNKRKGTSDGSLTQAQIRKLDKLGMVWDLRDQQWLEYYESAKKYYVSNGHLNIQKCYQAENGLKLGIWLVNQRSRYKKNGAGDKALSTSRIRMLNEIGMRWDTTKKTATDGKA